MDRLRLLVASPFPHFLAEYTASLGHAFEVQRANNEEVANFLCKEWVPHLVILDGDSPFFYHSFLLRQKFSLDQLGLVLITRDLSVQREEKAWKNGCDQVMNYPTHSELLSARLLALAQRIRRDGMQASSENLNQPTAPEPIAFGELRIHPRDHIIKRGDTLVTTTPLQFKLLLMFLNNKEQLLSRAWIKENIWGETEISLRSIDAQISKLRKIVPELDAHLINIYGKGYVFTNHQKAAA